MNFSKVIGTIVPKIEANMTTEKRDKDTAMEMCIRDRAEISQIIAYLKRMTNENGYYMMDLELIKKY